MLQSQDFIAVDQPLFSALNLFRQMYSDKAHNLPLYVWAAFDDAQRSANLNVKRFVWLVCLRCCPPICEYAVQNARDVDRTNRFMAYLSDDLEKLFRGGYSAYEFPVDEFIAAAILQYNA